MRKYCIDVLLSDGEVYTVNLPAKDELSAMKKAVIVATFDTDLTVIDARINLRPLNRPIGFIQ